MMPAVMSAEVAAPDRALVSSARAGEREAREELARRYRRPAYLLALQLTGRPELAQDVAQDCMMRFFQHLDRFDPQRPVEPWLYQIVRNRVRDLRRRERLRHTESLDAWREQGRPETVDTTATDPSRAAEQSELQGRIWHAISQLSDAHREILVLRDYHDLAYREISEVLSIPQGTVMSRLHAARKSLRGVLVAEGDVPQASRPAGGATDE
jgi:RNA polymerase sigma-70 factor (ECF subfamily)